ncbi:MAG: Na+/H+ antiporter NhaC family protein [Calditrichia bacterium]
MERNTRTLFGFLILLLLLPFALKAQGPVPFTVKTPRVVLNGIRFKLEVVPQAQYYIQFEGQEIPYRVIDAQSGRELASGSITVDARKIRPVPIPDIVLGRNGRTSLEVRVGDYTFRTGTLVIPAILSILPPLLAILLALVTRQVIVALFFGIWLGVTFVYDFNPFLGFLHTLDEYIINALASTDRISILIFSLVLGGMVGVIGRSGGTQGIVEKLRNYAKNPRRGQLATWAMGVLIFFDDYANTLIVGNTMRPLADKLRISREKLSYLVDSTAAPVANIAIISTWIGYEISLISQSFTALGVSDNAYITFIRTIPYNFYPIYALVFGLLVALLLRDFGSMYTAEIRTRRTGAVLRDNAMPLADLTDTEMAPDESIPHRWYNAFIPIGIVILTVILGLVYSGYQNLENPAELSGEGIIHQISLIVGNADSFAVLMWAAFLGSIAAILLAVGQRLLSLHQSLEAWVRGIRSMVMAAIILTSAWAIGSICQELFTADYVIHLTRQFLTPHWLPLITFFTAAVVSFATGTSWGTMAILMPIAIPLAFKFPQGHIGIDASHATNLMLSTTAAVLAGATFGDHCSPISDTTIMSSMASGADHVDHVRTQLPYALVVGAIAALFGYIPVGFDIGDWWVLFIGMIVIFLTVRFLGKSTAE